MDDGAWISPLATWRSIKSKSLNKPYGIIFSQITGIAPLHHAMHNQGLTTTPGSQNDAAAQRGSSVWGQVYAKVQLEIVGRRLLRPHRTSRNDRHCVGMPAPQRVVRTRLSDDFI